MIWEWRVAHVLGTSTTPISTANKNDNAKCVYTPWPAMSSVRGMDVVVESGSKEQGGGGLIV